MIAYFFYSFYFVNIAKINPMISPPNENKELICEIQNGNADVFEVLFRTYYSSLCDFAWQYVRSMSESEEIVETVFVNLWKNRKNWKPKGSIKSYLFCAIKNRSINFLKQPRIALKSDVDVYEMDIKGSSSVETVFQQKELGIAIQNGINKLPEKCRQVFQLVKLHGLSYKETAEILDISVKTVEVQMGRAFNKLRTTLAQYNK